MGKRTTAGTGQISMFDEIIVDSFAGGGGASTGIEIATGRVVDIAINHDPDAILMHRTNHPWTEHYQASVWDIDPKTVCKGRQVGLLWASPDCFTAGTLVLTQSGYKPIEEIKVGELVLTHKNRWMPVVETMTSVKPVMEVKGYGHPGIVCSLKHPFYAAQKGDGENSEAKFKTAVELQPGKDYWGVPVIQEAGNKITNATKGMAWLAGRYVGDGWLRTEEKHSEIVITCGKQDIDYLAAELPEKSKRRWSFREVRTGGQFTLCDKNITHWVLYNFGKLSHKKFIPTWLYSENAEIKKAFLEGYVSADGHREGGLIETTTVSKKLAFGLVTLIASLGKPATVYKAEQKTDVIDGRSVNVRPIWKVKWRDEIDEAHKQTFVKDDIVWRPIRSVKNLERTETVYNIGVAEDESYVAEGIIVHNCKHFSKAKGSALVDRNIRGLAWVVLRWAATVRPRVIMLENVEEFVTWGPVRKGKPVKKHSGETFRKWKNQLLSLGYAVEHRELVAADYGAPTSRKRFVLVARCDGRPIVWPERTHAPADSEEVKSGKCKPWRAAAEIIDWTLPMYSVFDSKEEIKRKFGVNAVRPLADATMRRIICGTDKYTIKSGCPFFIHHGKFQNAPQDAEKPLTTVTAVGAHELVAASIVSYHDEQGGNARVNGLADLLPTVDASNRFGLTTAQLVEYYGNATPPDLREPMRAVTSHDREGLTCCHIAEFKGKDKGQDARKPLRTITASCGEFAAVKTIIEQYDAERTVDGRPYGYWPEIRALLNKYCGYTLKDNEILLLIVDGTPFYIRDILLRMLAPRELYNAMGFPVDYIIDHDYTGKEYGKSKQVARCGNAVCPPMASAVVRANLPEWCGGKIETMEQFRKGVAV